MRSPGDFFFFFFFVDGRNQYRWKCSDALTETSDTYIFLKLEKVQRLSSKSNPLFHRRRCWDQKHEGTCLGMWAFSLWVSGLKVICVPYCAPAQWAAKFRLLENPDLIFLRSCTISCTESVCKKKKKKRYGERGLWHQMSEKRLFCIFALKGAAMLLSEACSKSSSWPGRWLSILAAHAH